MGVIATAKYLLFIDTNILLDFYRARNDAGLDLLAKIDGAVDQIVTSCQVEMEFKKNRQKVILDALAGLRAPDQNLAVPAFLRDAKALKAIRSGLRQIGKRFTVLQSQVKKVLTQPLTDDPISKCAQRLFASSSPLNLRQNSPAWERIWRRGYRRYGLGYPPRKDGDTSYGDAINWEWILECGLTTKRGIIIASRDSDYGMIVDGTSYLNDWLIQEFRSKVGKRRPVLLTSKLTEAFKMMSISVSAQEERDEDNLLQEAALNRGAYNVGSQSAFAALLGQTSSPLVSIPQAGSPYVSVETLQMGQPFPGLTEFMAQLTRPMAGAASAKDTSLPGDILAKKADPQHSGKDDTTKRKA